MIYDLESLKVKYSNYSNIAQKISIEIKKNNLVRVKKGLYTDNIKIDKPIIANLCYGLSYISFEYALSHYGLIPEYVSVFTSAVYNKKNNKTYCLSEAIFDYRSVPNNVFPLSIEILHNEAGIRYKIASKEKALCDTLYTKYPVRSIKDLKIMMFEDLRIDEDEFSKLNFDLISELSVLYKSNTLNTLNKYIKEMNNEITN